MKNLSLNGKQMTSNKWRTRSSAVWLKNFVSLKSENFAEENKLKLHGRRNYRKKRKKKHKIWQRWWMCHRWVVHRRVYSLVRQVAALVSLSPLEGNHTPVEMQVQPPKPNLIWLEQLVGNPHLKTSSICLKAVDKLLSYRKNTVNSLVWLWEIKISTKCKRVMPLLVNHKEVEQLKACEVLDPDLKEL